MHLNARAAQRHTSQIPPPRSARSGRDMRSQHQHGPRRRLGHQSCSILSPSRRPTSLYNAPRAVTPPPSGQHPRNRRIRPAESGGRPAHSRCSERCRPLPSVPFPTHRHAVAPPASGQHPRHRCIRPAESGGRPAHSRCSERCRPLPSVPPPMLHAAVQSRPPPPVSVRATAAYDQRNPPSHCSERCLQWPSVPPPSRAAGRGGRTQRARGSGEGTTSTAHEGSGEQRITNERRDAVRRIRLVALRARTLCPPHPAEVKIQKPATTSTGAALAVYTTRYGLPAPSVVGGARAGAPPLVPHTGVALVSRGHGAFENAASPRRRSAGASRASDTRTPPDLQTTGPMESVG